MGKPQPFERRFLAKIAIDPDRGCWLWHGSRFGNDNYGCISWLGKQVGAHVAAYRYYRGPVSKGLQVQHTCDVKLCVNPDHLYVGTKAQNMRDAVERGQAKTGLQHPRAKLTAHQLSVARSATPHTSRNVARAFGVHPKTIYRARKGVTYVN